MLVLVPTVLLTLHRTHTWKDHEYEDNDVNNNYDCDAYDDDDND